MMQPMAVGWLVACALDRGEACPPDTADAIRLALLGVCPAGCSCDAQIERRSKPGPPPGVERRRAARARR
jgi:hypothetical protein